MPKAIATNFAIRRDTTGRIFLELTTLKQRKFEFEINQSSLPTIRGHLIEALNLPRPTDQSGFQDMAAPILVQKIHVTPNHPVAGVISLGFEASNGRTIDIPLPNSDAEAMIGTVRQALETANQSNPPESSDAAAQNVLQKLDVTANPGSELISLRFEMSTRGGVIDMTLPIPIVEMMFEAIGKALTVAKSEPTATRQ
jgi:hypothetical protein